MEYKLFEGATPYVSTFEFHHDRERAPHLEQPVHRPRLERAAEFVREAVPLVNAKGFSIATVSDLGCGDGGLLQLLEGFVGVKAWGYDFAPANQGGWKERDVVASALDVFGADSNRVKFGDISICTEVLEHLADPHGVVKWIRLNSRFLIASSPWTETDQSHDGCHAWAWDQEGYRQLLEDGGWTILRHETVGMFQVVLAES